MNVIYGETKGEREILRKWYEGKGFSMDQSANIELSIVYRLSRPLIQLLPLELFRECESKYCLFAGLSSFRKYECRTVLPLSSSEEQPAATAASVSIAAWAPKLATHCRVSCAVLLRGDEYHHFA